MQRVNLDTLDNFATSPVPQGDLVTNVVATVIQNALIYTVTMSQAANIQMILLQREHRTVYIMSLN